MFVLFFFQYYCGLCKLFDDEDRQQYHCDGCGLCRVGGRDKFFHCNTCEMCLPISIVDTHKVSTAQSFHPLFSHFIYFCAVIFYQLSCPPSLFSYSSFLSFLFMSSLCSPFFNSFPLFSVLLSYHIFVLPFSLFFSFLKTIPLPFLLFISS